ncbi:MAG: hypothetical protein HGA45_28110 [Chloroflexales bacterium]|nr:hypothetical protein [Chloroflexales bacterium]
MSAVAPTAPQLRSLVRRHALLAFFGLTFALSWSLWGLQSLRARADPISVRWLGIIAAYGPTLAAVALAGLLRLEPQRVASSSRRLARPSPRRGRRGDLVAAVGAALGDEALTRLP